MPETCNRATARHYTFSEYLLDHAPRFQPPQLRRRAILHQHCHGRSVLDATKEQELLQQMVLDVRTPDTGCCGMAGSFGFEEEKYDVSVACGERVLLPEVRQAAADTLIVASGFSCREQVEQSTDRWPLHVAEVLQLALRRQRPAPGQHRQRLVARQPAPRLSSLEMAVGVGVVGALAAGGLALWKLSRRQQEIAW